jgi:hypothetical protein
MTGSRHVDEYLDLARPDAALAELLAIVGRWPGHDAGLVDEDVAWVRRTVRPSWAVVTALVTGVAFAGAGFLFLLVRSEEAARLERRGHRLHVTGRLHPDVLAQLETWAGGRPEAPDTAPAWLHPAPPSPAPPATRDESPAAPAPLPTSAAPAPDAVTPTPASPATARPSTAPDVPAHGDVDSSTDRASSGEPGRYRLVLDDGQELAFDGSALVGWDPAAAFGDPPDVALISIPASEGVAKTHVAIGFDDDGVWLQDRCSEHGTVVTHASGLRLRLAPGQRLRITPGTTVHLGARSLHLPG